MKKINIKATIFLSAIVLVVVVLLLNLIEFRKTVDFTVPGIQMPKENAFGKQEEVQVSVNGPIITGYCPGSTAALSMGRYLSLERERNRRIISLPMEQAEDF